MKYPSLFVTVIAMSFCYVNALGNDRTDASRNELSIENTLPPYQPIKRRIVDTRQENPEHLAIHRSPLGRYFTGEPVFGNGKMLGYRITLTDKIREFEEHGIFTGDIITSINKINLTSQKQGIRAQRNIVRGGDIDLILLRNGVEIKLYFTWLI